MLYIICAICGLIVGFWLCAFGSARKIKGTMKYDPKNRDIIFEFDAPIEKCGIKNGSFVIFRTVETDLSEHSKIIQSL